MNHSSADVLVLAATILVVGAGSIPLLRHLWNTPSNAPDDRPHRSVAEEQALKVEAAIDRYSTRWGGFSDDASTRRQQLK